ncbi:winged helix-turn-helix domain-containing protein [Enterococcus raffinosus]|uniref:winged helix-turn-helix domain-containing protein n=1 Tax=Enterococcus raffinosus TaxID=71452 RepID=UPI001C96F7A8|nr:helix-turn-helix domain-containing protein [Enterococcus raffinosus]QZO10894.1 helix-turn-helix domain-containing protein [Enterococcus raffinosus]
MNVLVLTKCFFAEEELVRKLSMLGYEVFCSSHLLKGLTVKTSIYPVINYFPIIIFSETVSDEEIEQILKNETIQTANVFRKATTFLGNYKSQSSEFLSMLFMDEPLEEISKKLKKNYIHSLENSSLNILSFDIKDLDSILLLSKQEKQVFEILYDAKGDLVSREEICEKVWSQVTKSNLAQTSTIVKRIKVKLEESGFVNCDLQTIWGKGYRIMAE